MPRRVAPGLFLGAPAACLNEPLLRMLELTHVLLLSADADDDGADDGDADGAAGRH